MPQSLCEERLIALGKKGYELKNHVVGEEETVITLQTKITFSSMGQRITIAIKEEDEKTSAVTIRSELISNIQARDRGANQQNINTLFEYLGKKE